jgi:hypothetical protein
MTQKSRKKQLRSTNTTIGEEEKVGKNNTSMKPSSTV